MKIDRLPWARLLVFIVSLLGLEGVAVAANTTGTLFGKVLDAESGRPVEGVTVIVTGPQGDTGTMTGDDGSYELRALPIGKYVARYYYGTVTLEKEVTVSLDKTVHLNVRMPSTSDAVEVVQVVERAPAVDVGSTRAGSTLDENFTRNVPLPFNIGGALEKAPGAYLDPIPKYMGAGSFEDPFPSHSLSLGGATGPENAFYIDGLNVTSIGYGLLGIDLPTPFVQEVEIISSGYSAEYGRALAGVVNIATKSGTNELRGSAFSLVTPRFLAGDARRAYSWATSITGVHQPDYVLNLGAEVGGPIIKNRLFFWAGYAPQIARYRTDRFVNAFVDADGDGAPDAQDGRPAVTELYSSRHRSDGLTHQYAGKLTFRPNPQNDLSLALFGATFDREFVRRWTMDPRAAMSREEVATHDLNARWLGQFLDRRWQVEANAGVHLEESRHNSPFADLRERNAVVWYTSPSLSQFDDDPSVQAGCMADAATGFQPCPAQEYQSGGYGGFRDTSASRIAAQLKSLHLLRGAGWHQFKYGLDLELNRYDDTRGLSGPEGGRGYLLMNPGYALSQTLFRYQQGERSWTRTDGDETDPDPNMDGKRSDLFEPPWYQDQVRAKTQTRNTGLFVQDGWSPLSNLTFNVGVRWETQQLTDFEGNNALTIYDAIAPRIGAIYDPTDDGRAKVFGHFGRFYESIPMDLNNRAFGGEGILIGVYPVEQLCAKPFAEWGDGDPSATWQSCDRSPIPEAATIFPFAGENLHVQRKIKGTHSDEIVLGGQYEILPDLVLGATVIRRWLGRAIEDAGPAPGNTIVANPGDIPEDVVRDYEQRAQAAEEAAMAPGAGPDAQGAAAEARFQADAVKAVSQFPKPKREYNALQLTAQHRFARNWLAHASYTYSRTKGNFPGLYAADSNQLDPNYTLQFDLIEAMINRDGPLPNDRPHLFRVDGYYQLPLGAHTVTGGLGFVARSGRPLNYLGNHPLAGSNESFVLPRGAAGRTPFVTRLDLHLAYRFQMTSKTAVDAFIDVFNLLNQRTALVQDSTYTFSSVEPIVGGDKSDLVHLKDVTTGEPAEKNPNFKNAQLFQAPISGRLGLRVLF